ncbi:hypothetical protein G5S34_14705 [Herbaspirillum frisingense]|uniref:hypothetical protein n=1 Tax=Herbaspirillum frisingense TaxID=92645 RepID=UPI0016036C9A|nr:hypothetical protein [Herbaspirillum frisingense]QNB07886.1 hypothetical protein G5S34_14705 [Herbaspirillum frisingense]
MESNVSRFKADLHKLIQTGQTLAVAMRHECAPKESTQMIRKKYGDDAQEVIDSLPKFATAYQAWYSESLALLRQILPDRLNDFVRHYEKPKARKELTQENYRIEDYLQGIQVSLRGTVTVPTSSAIPHFSQQLAIIKAAQGRFDSSLFEIRQIVQAEMLDSELETAEELSKFKFTRAAGAIAGVVLERHLAQVCTDRKLPIGKKNPTINDFNEALKASAVIDVPQWRYIQHLGDIRNLCDHSRSPEPTQEQVLDLITGVKRIIKTVS